MSTPLGENVPRQDSTPGNRRITLLTIASEPDGAGHRFVIRLNPVAKRLYIEKHDAAGAAIGAAGGFILDLDDTLGSDGNNHHLYAQETTVCVDVSGVITEKKAMVLMSDPY
ncbi:MAG: hypothetical protein JWR69_1740 [Pedosphaera sp.]|nr:hypothetical protein [Pedosphaera sp.]